MKLICLKTSAFLALAGALFACTAAPSDAASTGAAIVASPLATRDFMVTSRDVPLHATMVGGYDGGPAIVAINGGPGFSDDYMMPLAQLASSDVRVVFFDQRGTGGSIAPETATFTAEDYALDVDAIRGALGLDTIHVLGHSWGGGLSLLYTAAFPEHVASLTLIDNLPPTSTGFAAGQARFQAHMTDLTGMGLVPNPIPPPQGDDCSPMVLATFPVYCADPHFPMPKEIAATRCSQRVLGTTYAAILEPGFDFTAPLQAFHGPSHVLFGDSDAYGLAWQSETAAALAQTTPTVTTIAGAGHYPWVERPAETFQALRGFYSAAGLAVSAGQ